ncbi:hypothetical protein ACE10Z_20800 [Bradyrhizobium sp. Pha-3]|uniref:hypothetical protein n=1 Tax=Bradyrhizobium sp. Pha-3 TaxID=208375 RepID=UPI0035D4BF86
MASHNNFHRSRPTIDESQGSHLSGMVIPRKSIEVPPEVARQFAADMQAYHAGQDDNERDRITVGSQHMLLQHSVGTKLRLSEVKLFELMR